MGFGDGLEPPAVTKPGKWENHYKLTFKQGHHRTACAISQPCLIIVEALWYIIFPAKKYQDSSAWFHRLRGPRRGPSFSKPRWGYGIWLHPPVFAVSDDGGRPLCRSHWGGGGVRSEWNQKPELFGRCLIEYEWTWYMMIYGYILYMVLLCYLYVFLALHVQWV